MNEVQRERQEAHERMVRQEAIRLGLIDIGPVAVHTAVTDTRDLRDPVVLGEELLATASLAREGEFGGRGGPNATLSDTYDAFNFDYVEPFPKDQSLLQETVDAYRRKMQKQAVAGDVYALRVLLDKAWEVPDDVDQATLERAREMTSAEAEVVE